MTSSLEHRTKSKRPRLIILTQWFDPEPTFKGLVFAEAMQERGFDVEVVTGFPNYPGGTVYDGYKVRLICREKVGGIDITRLALYASHDRNPVARFANYASFCISCIIYLTFFARKAQVLYAYHPPLTVGVAASVAKLFRGTPMVLDIQDIWPDTLSATGMLNNRRALNTVSNICQWVYRQANHIVVLSPGFRRLLVERGVLAKKIDVIYNWADEKSITGRHGEMPASMGKSGKFRILFAGNMGRAQGLDIVLDAAKILTKNAANVEFCFLGSGVDLKRLQTRAESESIENVVFLPQVPMGAVGAYLQAADCLLVHLRTDPLFSITIPSKTQAYLAAGKPIIMGVPGDATELILRSGGGLTFPSEDSEALAAIVCGLSTKSPQYLLSMGSAGQEYYFKHLSLKAGADAFASLFARTLHRKTFDSATASNGS